MEKSSEADRLKLLGNECMGQKNFEKAIQLYTESIKLKPSPATFSNRSLAYLKISENSKALKDANSSINLDPEFLKGYYRRAKAYFAQEKKDLGIKDYLFILSKDPGNKEVQDDMIQMMSSEMGKNNGPPTKQNLKQLTPLEKIDKENYESCFVCNKKDTFLCDKCNSVYYCSKQCQFFDAPEHSMGCKEFSRYKNLAVFSGLTDFAMLQTLQRKVKSSEEYRNLMIRRFQILHNYKHQSGMAIVYNSGGGDRRKPSQLIEKQVHSLQIMFLNEIKIDEINKGRFLILKAIIESQKGSSILLITEDQLKEPMRLGIYNTTYNVIKQDQMLIVKEPFLKLAQDGLNIIRIDNPEDIIFISPEKENDSDYFTCFIKHVDIKKLQFQIVTLQPIQIQNNQDIYFKFQNEWLQSRVEMLQNEIFDSFQQKVFCSYFKQIQLDENSQSFMNSLKKAFQSSPGILQRFYAPKLIDPEKLISEKLKQFNYPQELLGRLKFLVNQIDKSKNVRNEIEKIWSDNLDLIKEIYQDFIEYEGGQKNEIKDKNTQLVKMKMEKIDQILEALSRTENSPNQAFEELFNKDELIITNNSFIPYKVTVQEEQARQIFPNQSDFNQLQCQDDFSNEQTLRMLYKASTELKGICKQILQYWKSQLISGQIYEGIQFSNLCFKKFVIKGKLSQKLVEDCLEILGVNYNKIQFEEILSQVESKKLTKTLSKKLKRLQIEDVDQIVIISNPEEQEQIEEEFPKQAIMNTEEELKASENQSESNYQSEQQSVLSFLTVHSRDGMQRSNDHWKDRYLERGRNVQNDDWKLILEQLKKQLKNNQGVYLSEKRSDRLMIQTPEGLKFILQSKGQVNSKELFIPVTVLAPYMKFK